MPTKVKICGVKDAETAKFAEDNGAEFLGFVFFKKSPRNISTKEFSEIKKSLSGKAKTVAVVVNPDDALLKKIKENKFDYAQLHGKESPERVAEIIMSFDLKIIKAISVAEKKDIEKAEKFSKLCEYILFDARPPKNSDLPGGNAVSFNWGLLKDFSASYNWILSGGLTPENVKKATSITKAGFVDVSSGVESAPGTKDLSKIADFISNAKS